MTLSILAGMMIALGGVVNLQLGGVAGAIFFAVGLLTILQFKMELFTGKAGLLATNEIEFDDLVRIWIGNFIGCFIVALCLYITPLGAVLYESAQTIVALRIANGPIANLMYGIFCGMMMYIAVTGYSKSQNVIFVFVPVAVFILSGFNHCVADMFYMLMGANTIEGFGTLIPSTIGNVIGAYSLSGSLQWATHHQ